MQPYQRASEEIQRQGELPSKAIKTGTSLAASAYGGGIALNKVVPFLSKYIPPDLAIKGLNKIDPRFGTFINTALKNGKSFDEIKDFIQLKTEEGKESQPPKQERNIIEQYSPELNEFIKTSVSKGMNPLEAGARARLDKKHEKTIKNIEKDHKTDWSSVLQTVFGSSINNPIRNNQQQTQQPQQSIQQPGQGQQALMGILQKIDQRLGG